MTGKALFDALAWAWAYEQRRSSRHENAIGVGFLLSRPPAWPFLSVGERDAFEAAARTLTPSAEKTT